MLQAQILKRCVSDDEPVLADFVASMVEPFITQHSLTAAKGSTHHYFGKNPDQSMVAHVFNGIFPTMRLLALAQKFRRREYLSDTGQRLYILGYAMHDLNKIRGLMEEISTADQSQVQIALGMLQEELQHLNTVAFFPQYEAYLEDILYLVVNTQLESGANRSSYQFPNRCHDEREIERARDLCTYSDCLSFLVKNPADVLHGEARATFERVVRDVSDNRFSLAYHQFSDVRGLLTNTINNGVKNLLSPEPEDASQVGAFISYLYFPNGIVYLQTQRDAQPDLSSGRVWDAVAKTLSADALSRINENTPGFGFNQKSNLKYPTYFEDLLKAVDFINLMIKVCLRTRANVTKSTGEVLQTMTATNKLPPEANLNYYPAEDERIAIVGRFLLNFDKLIMERVLQPEAREALVQLIKATFGFSDEVMAVAEKIPSNGGMDYRYFWLGAQFVARQRHLSPEGEEVGSLRHFLTSFVTAAQPLLEPALQETWRGNLLPQLQKYVTTHLSFGGLGPNNQPDLPDFQAELGNYLAAKRQPQAKFPCTICNSSYLVEGRKQTDAEVLFQPWVYKNRLPLHANENAGGVCAICLLEMMLRQLKQKDELKLTGKDFEEIRLKFLYLYPCYFFTTETSQLIQELIASLDTFSISETNKKLADTALEPAQYLALELFQSSEAYDEENKPRGYYRMDYDEKDAQGLIFFGMKALNRDPSATETWALPALMGLMLPLVLGCKVVVSDNYLPLFASGEDFKETVVLDAPHHFLSYLLTSDLDSTEGLTEKRLAKVKSLGISPAGRVRIDKVMEKLRLLSRAYFINYDTYRGSKGEPGWNMLNRVARAIRTDPLNIFHFLAMQARAGDAKSLAEGFWPRHTQRYMNAYDDIWSSLEKVIGGKNPMEVISGLVERYTLFYRPTFRSSSIVRPIELTAKLLLAHPREKVQGEEEYAHDMKLIMQGELMRWLERVRNSEGSGRAVFYGRDVSEKEAPALQDFTDFFYDEVFKRYCRGQAGLLRSRLNNIKSGCEAYYSVNWKKWGKPAEEVATEAE
jgi:CRISPR-associated protein Csc3